LKKGRGQFAFEVHEQAQLRSTSFAAFPMAGMSARYGATDRVELGGRFGPSGLEGQVKVQLTSTDAPPHSTAISIAPAASWWGVDVSGIALRSYNFDLPVLIGIPVGTGDELVLGPRVHDTVLYGQSGSASGTIHLLSAGASIGLLIPAIPMSFMPEIAVLVPLATGTVRPDATGGLAWGTGRWTLQAGVAVMLGGQ
jgi:hypothetical protein